MKHVSDTQKFIDYYKTTGSSTASNKGLGNAFGSMESRVIPLEARGNSVSKPKTMKAKIIAPTESTVERARAAYKKKRTIKNKHSSRKRGKKACKKRGVKKQKKIVRKKIRKDIFG